MATVQLREIAVEYLTFIATLLTILGVSFRDLPLVRRLTVKIRIPYVIWSRVIFYERPGISRLLQHNPLPYNTRADKLLYRLFGYYRELRIASNKISCLGCPEQFEHRTSVKTPNFSRCMTRLTQEYFPETKFQELFQIIALWAPYTAEAFDSRIVEVVQVSMLVSLGYQIPAIEKRPLVEFVGDFFLLQYRKHNQNASQEYLVHTYTALTYLIPVRKRTAYLAKNKPAKILGNPNSGLFASIEKLNRLLESTRMAL